MEKVEVCSETSFCALVCIGLGFDDIARKRIREQLGLIPSEEDELLMFLLYRSILY